MSEELDPDRPIRYERDGNIYYRASAIGSCIRALVAASMPRAYPPREHQDWFLKVLDEGKRMEDHIDAMWAEKSGVPTNRKQRRVTLYIGEINGRDVYVEGSIDGMEAINTREWEVLREYKKFRDSTWPNFLRQGIEVHANYPWQTSIYMHALRQELGVPVDVQFVGGHYWCVKDDDGNVIEEGISEVECKVITSVAPIPLRAIMAKIAKVENLINDGFDPKEVDCQLKYPCPWYYLHDKQEPAAPAPLAVPVTDELLIMVSEYEVARGQAAEARKAMDEADKRAKALRGAILGQFADAGHKAGDSIELGEGVVAKWTESKVEAHIVKESTRTSLNIKVTPIDDGTAGVVGGASPTTPKRKKASK